MKGFHSIYSRFIRLLSLNSGTFGVKEHLCASEHGDCLTTITMGDDRIPNLRCPTEVSGGCNTLNNPVSCCPKVIAFQLDGREAARSRREIGDTTIAGGSVSKRDDGASVQVPIWRQKLRLHLKFSPNQPVFDCRDDYSEMAGQEA
jgi:hypothetical protein